MDFQNLLLIFMFFWCLIGLPMVKCWLMVVHKPSGERAELIERDQCSWAQSPGERAQGSGEVGLLWRGTKVCGCGLLGGRRAISVQDTWLGMEKRMVLKNVCNITHSLGKCIRISTYICIEFSRRIWENYEHRLPLGVRFMGALALCLCDFIIRSVFAMGGDIFWNGAQDKKDILIYRF